MKPIIQMTEGVEGVDIFTEQEKEKLRGLAADLGKAAAELGFDCDIEFSKSPIAEQYATCGHCGGDRELPPTQCPATGWDTHPENTKPPASIFEKVRLLEREVEKLQENNAMMRMEKAALEHGHAEAEKQIALLESRLKDRLKQIAGLERNNKELRELGAGKANLTERVVFLEGQLDKANGLINKALASARRHFQELDVCDLTVEEAMEYVIGKGRERGERIMRETENRVASLKKELEQANAARRVDHSQVPAAGADQILSLRERIAGLKQELNSQDRKIADLECGNQMLRGNIAELNDEIISKDLRIGELNVLLTNERQAVKNREEETRGTAKELAGYMRRHLEISQAFYDETDGPAVKDNHADWIRQSKRLRKSFNESIGAMLIEEENLINSYAKPPVNPFPRLR